MAYNNNLVLTIIRMCYIILSVHMCCEGMYFLPQVGNLFFLWVRVAGKKHCNFRCGFDVSVFEACEQFFVSSTSYGSRDIGLISFCQFRGNETMLLK